MQFCSADEVEVWCAERGLPATEARSVRALLYEDGALSRRRLPYTYQQPQTAPALSAELVAALAPWDEAVLWVTEWGIWPSSEDWPAYYAARGAHGERRSIDEAPGHVFDSRERDALATFVTLALQNGWDAFVLTARDGRLAAVRLRISHDEWAEVQTAPATTPHAPAG